MAKLLEGKILAEKIKAELKANIGKLSKPPVLASIIVGDNCGSQSYVKIQAKLAQELGIDYKLCPLSPDIAEDELIDFILKLNQDPEVNGVILESPLPLGIDYMRVCEFIQPEKDVEGMHPVNVGRMIFGRSRIAACTANAVMALLDSTGIDLYGKEAVVVGHSEVVGKPLAMMLLEKFATVTVCHIATSKADKLKSHVERADILAVAVGSPGLIKGDWVKEGSIVIDVGINCLNDKVVGDVEFEAAAKRAAYITPVPGGVGPLTVMILMRNLIEAALAQESQARNK